MPYEISWVVKNRLVLNRAWGNLSLDDIQGISNQLSIYVEEALEDGCDKLPAIFDMRQVNDIALPSSSNSSEHAQEMTQMIDSRLQNMKRGFLVLVTSRQHVRDFVTFINQVLAQPMTTVQTIEEALTIMQNMYPNLREHLSTQKGSVSL